MTNFRRLEHHIEAALAYAGGTHTVDDVMAAITTDHLQFWPGLDSFVITELEVYPRKKVCHLFLGGGTLDGIRRMLPHIEQWAVREGCSAVTLTGRNGWARSPLRDDGYQVKWQVMAKELN